jgi:Cysteine-rich CPCC
VHPCPCCGYRTLPGRDLYDLCPVCWWEDEGTEPLEYSAPNGRTLVEAQREYLARRLPHRLRPGKVRAPKRHEARDATWRPIEVTADQLRRLAQEAEQLDLDLEDEARRAPTELADDPPEIKAYNAAMKVLRAEAPLLPHDVVKDRLRRLGEAHGVAFSDGHLELIARLTKDETYYRRRPDRAVRHLVRHSRPGTVVRRWRELRTGRVTLAG